MAKEGVGLLFGLHDLIQEIAGPSRSKNVIQDSKSKRICH